MHYRQFTFLIAKMDPLELIQQVSGVKFKIFFNDGKIRHWTTEGTSAVELWR